MLAIKKEQIKDQVLPSCPQYLPEFETQAFLTNSSQKIKTAAYFVTTAIVDARCNSTHATSAKTSFTKALKSLSQNSEQQQPLVDFIHSKRFKQIRANFNQESGLVHTDY